jgi:hypothetical protein
MDAQRSTTYRRSMEAANRQHGLQVPSTPCLQPLWQVVLQRVANKIKLCEVAQSCRIPQNTTTQMCDDVRTQMCDDVSSSVHVSHEHAQAESECTHAERARERARWGGSCTLLRRHLRCSEVCFQDSCRADRGR